MKLVHSLVSFAALSALTLPAAAEAYATGQCAGTLQKEQILAHYKAAPASPPLVVQRIFNINEETVVSALPESMAVGTDAKHFAEVTALFADIPGQIQYVVEAADTVSKFFGPITKVNDTVDDDVWFDLISEGVLENGDNGLMIHLRPENLSTIYAVDLPGGEMADGTVREGATRAVIFYGKDGRSAIGIYVTLVSDGTPEAVAAFDKVFEKVKSLPRAC